MSNSSKSFWDDEEKLKKTHEINDGFPKKLKSLETLLDDNEQDSKSISNDYVENKKHPNKKRIEKSSRGNNYEFQPEQVVLRKKNKKDFIIIASVVIVLVIGIVLGTVFLYDSGNRKIYSYIDSGSYAVAYKEINELYENGENVDSLVMVYVEACMSDIEYKRAANAVYMLSDEGFSKNKESLNQFVQQIYNSGKTNLAEQMSSILENHNVK